MQRSDFNYHLPQSLIAQMPLPERTASRLLAVFPADDRLADYRFSDLQTLLNPGDLLVFNNTRVLPARLFGKKHTGGKVEVLVERLLDARQLLAQVRSSRAPRPGSRLLLETQIECSVCARRGDLFLLQQEGPQCWLDLLEVHGRLPLPGYIERAVNAEDAERYQTVYAQIPGAVAAPTAGLHFDRAQMAALEAQGVNSAYITVHVGAGTFQPLRVNNLDDHVMHAEAVQVSDSVCAAITQTQDAGHRVIAVGTTVARGLETAAVKGHLTAFNGDSQLFIKPGFQFRVIDALVTNFHLPQSTLLMLVSAFAGHALISRAYAHAIAQSYRFFSYGDAMLIASRTPDQRNL